MSLGEQLSPHLPFLRRFARALSGSQTAGDSVVRATLERIVSEPASFPRDVDPRLGIYRLFLNVLHEQGDLQPSTDEGGSSEQVARARLRLVPDAARKALLLTAMENFTSEDAGWLLDIPKAHVDGLVADALSEIERQTKARVLIIEDEPIIAMDIETIVRGLGHEVTGVAVTRSEAVTLAMKDRPGLVLADIQLADNSTGIDAVKDILAHFVVPVIFITAFPERLLSGNRSEPTFLVTKPFQRSMLKAAISQALFFNQATLPETVEQQQSLAEGGEPSIALKTPANSKVVQQQLHALDDADLEPLTGPVDATVIGGRLRQVHSAPVETRLGTDRIATLWRVHAATALRIAGELEGSNAGRAFTARLNAVHHALAVTPNDNDALAIGVQSRGLARMLPAVRDELMDDVAADLDAFVADLRQLARHFSSYREFVGEAEKSPAMASERVAELTATAKLLEAAPDDTVDPELKESIADVRTNAQDVPDAVTRFALLRTIGNVLKGLIRHFRDLSTASATKFAEELGSGLGKLTIQLAKGGVLLGIAHFAPSEVTTILAVLAVARLVDNSSDKKSKD